MSRSENNGSGSTAVANVNAVMIENNEKWDHSVENLIRKSTLGIATGILPALLLARSPAARAAIVSLCAGIGSGMAYGESRYLFDHNILFDRRHLVHIELFTPKEA